MHVVVMMMMDERMLDSGSVDACLWIQEAWNMAYVGQLGWVWVVGSGNCGMTRRRKAANELQSERSDKQIGA